MRKLGTETDTELHRADVRKAWHPCKIQSFAVHTVLSKPPVVLGKQGIFAMAQQITWSLTKWVRLSRDVTTITEKFLWPAWSACNYSASVHSQIANITIMHHPSLCLANSCASLVWKPYFFSMHILGFDYDGATEYLANKCLGDGLPRRWSA